MGLFSKSGYPAPYPNYAGIVGFSSASGVSGFSGATSYDCAAETELVRVCSDVNCVVGFSGFSGYYASECRDHYLPSGHVGEFAVNPGGAKLVVASVDGSAGTLHVTECTI